MERIGSVGVQSGFTKAWALWWKRSPSVLRPREQVEWPYPERLDT